MLRARVIAELFRGHFASPVGPRDSEKMTLKRFMPVARGTRPAYRIKTRGELVFGDTRNIAPRRCAGTYTHVYGATRIRIGVYPPGDPGYDVRPGVENND